MRIISKGILILAVIVTLMTPSFDTEAKTVTRYATKTIKLQERCSDHAKTIEKLRQNDKVILLKKGKRWSKVIHAEQVGYVKTSALHAKKPVNKYKGRSFKRVGHGRYNGCSWTWYTTRQYPDRKNALGIKGKHKDKRGFICDKDGYICLASGRGNKKKHAIVPTPFGKYGKVYDTNGGYNNRWFDVYTTW